MFVLTVKLTNIVHISKYHQLIFSLSDRESCNRTLSQTVFLLFEQPSFVSSVILKKATVAYKKVENEYELEKELLNHLFSPEDTGTRTGAVRTRLQ